MRIEFIGVSGDLDAVVEVDIAQVAEVSVLIYDEAYYLFDGVTSSPTPKIYGPDSTVRFRRIAAPLVIAMQPQPQPERKFFGKKG